MTQRNCLQCSKLTTNPKYCSKSCAATANNKLTPKRKLKVVHCRRCKKQIDRSSYLVQRTVCDSCYWKNWDVLTIGDLQGRRSYQKNSQIRDLARRRFFAENPNPRCAKCKYATHVEVCHIHPIASFPESTPINVVNALSNLIGLCPTHHWELDNGHLDFTEFENLHSKGFPKEAQ
jgi:predicted restriction endonuclease